MAKNSIRDYSATSSLNTDVQSVDISEGCAASGINNAIREVMADLKDVSSGTIALESPQADSLTVTGDLTVDTNTLHVDAANNNVGIGLSSPLANYKIHVDANSDSDGRVARFSQAGTDNAIVDVTAQNGTNTEAFSRYRNDANFFSVGIDGNDNFSIGKSFANTIGNTRVTVLSGGGLTFNGDTAAANALDDYEEGTWTPTDNSGAGLTFTNADGYYTKVGDLVFAAFRLTYPTTGATNLAALAGLPFTAGSIADSMYGGTATYHQDSIDMFQFLVGNNNATISIFYGGANQRGVNNFSGKPLRGFVVYKV